ncbi:hypothetical protein, partial [Gilliamella sp. B3804]
FPAHNNKATGWYSMPNGYIHQFGTINLPPIGDYNALNINGTIYYTNIYKILFPRSYPVTQITTTVSLAGQPLHRDKQYNEYGTWVRSNRGEREKEGVVSRSSFDVSVTSSTLGYIPIIHFYSVGC